MRSFRRRRSRGGTAGICTRAGRRIAKACRGVWRVMRSCMSARIGLAALLLLVVTLGASVPAHAQGVGIFARDNCNTLTSPVVGGTFCFDKSANALKFWSGTSWLTAAATGNYPVLDASTMVGA